MQASQTGCHTGPQYTESCFCLSVVSVNEPVRILESPLDIFESSNDELGALSSHEVELEVFSSPLSLVLQDQIQQRTKKSFHRKRYKHV